MFNESLIKVSTFLHYTSNYISSIETTPLVPGGLSTIALASAVYIVLSPAPVLRFPTNHLTMYFDSPGVAFNKRLITMLSFLLIASRPFISEISLKPSKTRANVRDD